VPASTAPGSSVHVRAVEASCHTGSPTDNATKTSATPLASASQPHPNCRRNSRAEAPPASCGQLNVRLVSSSNTIRGAAIIGQLIFHAAT